MQAQIDFPMTGTTVSDEDDELYRLYVRFLRDAQAEVRRRMPAGRDCDAQLVYCEPLPREHFEAKLQSARHDPERYRQIVRQLRQGYTA